MPPQHMLPWQLRNTRHMPTLTYVLMPCQVDPIKQGLMMNTTVFTVGHGQGREA